MYHTLILPAYALATSVADIMSPQSASDNPLATPALLTPSC